MSHALHDQVLNRVAYHSGYDLRFARITIRRNMPEDLIYEIGYSLSSTSSAAASYHAGGPSFYVGLNVSASESNMQSDLAVAIHSQIWIVHADRANCSRIADAVVYSYLTNNIPIFKYDKVLFPIIVVSA